MSLTAQEDKDLTEILMAIEPEMKTLRERERDFVQETLNRHEQYGSDIRFSVKQWDWLRAIHQRVTGDDESSESEPWRRE